MIDCERKEIRSMMEQEEQRYKHLGIIAIILAFIFIVELKPPVEIGFVLGFFAFVIEDMYQTRKARITPKHEYKGFVLGTRHFVSFVFIITLIIGSMIASSFFY